jgi:hypothetical protein
LDEDKLVTRSYEPFSASDLALFAFGEPAFQVGVMSTLYRYSPLESPEYIRLVHFKPGTADDSIFCEVHHASLADSPFYEALSYTWDIDEPTGNPPQYHTIACGEFQLSVASNFFSGMRHLRYDDEDFILWADAVCIYLD